MRNIQQSEVYIYIVNNTLDEKKIESSSDRVDII